MSIVCNSQLSNATEISIFAVFSNGDSRLLFRGENRIMDASKAEVLSSLYDPDYLQNKIATFKVGIGGTNTPGGPDVKPVPGDLTDLYSPVTPSGNYDNILGAPLVTTDGLEITYQFSIPDPALVGQQINEVAMFKENGEIFNMKTFPSVLKSSGFSLAFIWRIRYK